jgi:hypothetical protein
MPAKKSTGGKKRKAGKAMKRKTESKRKVKKARTSSKKKPKKKKSSYVTTIKQEVHGKMTRKNVSYFGFQATAGMDELFNVAADSVLRAVLKKHNVGIRRTDEAVLVQSAVPQMTKAVFWYTRTKYSDGSTDSSISGTVIDFASGTYESKVQAFALELKAKVAGGYYPDYYESKAANNTIINVSRKVGDAKLNLSVKRTIKLRNITKNDDGDHDTNALDTNPLQGRLYKFRHDVPRVQPTLYKSDPTAWARFHDRVCTAGVMFGPQRNETDDHDGVIAAATTSNWYALMGSDRVLSSPPPGGRVWDNLSSSKKIGMAPGQAAQHKMAFKFAGTFRQFLSKFAASEYTVPSIGYCHMFGFEQKFKTGASDIINIEYDCDDVLKGGATFVREDITPPTVRTLHQHSSTF